MRFPAPPHTKAAKEKMSRAKKGAAQSKELVEKRAAALRASAVKTGSAGQKKAAAASALSRQRWAAMSAEERFEALRAKNQSRANRAFWERRKQWRADITQAALRGWTELVKDLQKSNGWRFERKLYDPTGVVSHGWAKRCCWRDEDRPRRAKPYGQT